MNPEEFANQTERILWKTVYYGTLVMAVLCSLGVAYDAFLISAEVSALGLDIGQIASTVIRELAADPLDLTMTAVVVASALANHHSAGMLNSLHQEDNQ
ncbi:MAG: hypothetical protein V1487_02740 [bacterium]